MIWERVPIESQVVTIRSQQAIVGVVVIDNESNIIEDHRGLKTAAYARYSISPLLHTNQQSRGVAQKSHSPCFTDGLRGIPVYFNSMKDTLYFENKDSFDTFTDLYFYPAASLWKSRVIVCQSLEAISTLAFGDASLIEALQALKVCGSVTKLFLRVKGTHINIRKEYMQYRISLAQSNKETDTWSKVNGEKEIWEEVERAARPCIKLFTVTEIEDVLQLQVYQQNIIYTQYMRLILIQKVKTAALGQDKGLNAKSARDVRVSA